MAKRIGILTCSNVKQEAGCSSFGCLEAIKKQEGGFARYADNGGVELCGLITCAGCPTAVAPDKILRQVRTLAATGVEAIHVSSCMSTVCPFKLKYMKAIREAFPHIEVVDGTHEADKQVKEVFVTSLQGWLTQPRQGMADLVEAQMKQQAQAG